MSGESPGATSVLEWSDEDAGEVYLVCKVPAHASTAPYANFATILRVDRSTETKTQRAQGVSINNDRSAQRLQVNALEAMANILRRKDEKSDELRIAILAMADESVLEFQDADSASENWMELINGYAPGHLLALAKAGSRPSSPVRSTNPPPAPLPPPSLEIQAVTHVIQGEALSVVLHCAEGSPPTTKSYVLNVFVDARVLQNCVTLPDTNNDFHTYLGIWHIDTAGEDAPLPSSTGDQAILDAAAALIPIGTGEMTKALHALLGAGVSAFVTNAAGAAEGDSDILPTFRAEGEKSTHKSGAAYTRLCAGWRATAEAETGDAKVSDLKAYTHQTFNGGIPWTVVSVDGKKLPTTGTVQALDFLSDLLAAVGYSSTSSSPYSIKATFNARAAGTRGDAAAVFASTGRTMGFNSVNEISANDMLALVEAVAMAWRREPLIFYWGVHHTRAAVAILPGVERPTNSPNVPLRIKVSRDATFAKLMAAISAQCKGPFVIRRATPVASLVSTLPLTEEQIKTDILLWFFRPGDVDTAAALAAAMVKWSVEHPRTLLGDAGGAVSIVMEGYHLERDTLTRDGQLVAYDSFISDDVKSIDVERGDNARGTIIAHLHGVRNTMDVRRQKSLLDYVARRLDSERTGGLYMPGKRALRQCLQYKMTGKKSKQYGMIVLINISDADFVATVDLAADERDRYGTSGTLCSGGNKSFSVLTVELAPPDPGKHANMYALTGLGVCNRCSLPGHEAVHCRESPGVCLQRSEGGFLGGGCCRTRVAGPNGLVCPSEIEGSTLVCGYGNRRDPDHQTRAKARFLLYPKQRTGRAAWAYIMYFNKQLAREGDLHLPGDCILPPKPLPTVSALAAAPSTASSTTTKEERRRLDEADEAAAADLADELEAREELKAAMRREGVWFPNAREVKLQIGDTPMRVVGGPIRRDLASERTVHEQEESRAHNLVMRKENQAAMREGGGTISFLEQAGAMSGGHIVQFDDLTAQAKAAVVYKWSSMNSQTGGGHRADGLAQLMGMTPITPRRTLPAGTGITPQLRDMMATPQQDGRKKGRNAHKRRSILDGGATSAKRGKKPVRPQRGTTPNAPGAPFDDAH